MLLIELKIKRESLAYQIREYKRLERTTKSVRTQGILMSRRVSKLKVEARACNLAIAYLQGKRFLDIEHKNYGFGDVIHKASSLALGYPCNNISNKFFRWATRG